MISMDRVHAEADNERYPKPTPKYEVLCENRSCGNAIRCLLEVEIHDTTEKVG